MIKIKMTAAIDEYLRWGKARGLKPNTLRNQQDALIPLSRSTGDIYVSSVTPLHIERHFTSQQWKESTRNVKLTLLRGFFTWADKRGYKDPKVELLYGWRTLTVPQRERLRVPVHEWPRLFDACEHITETATLALGLYLFLRVSESKVLTVGDVRFHSSTVAVWRPKTSTFDELPMCSELETIMRQYVSWYTEHLASRGISMQPSHILLAPRNTTDPGWIRGEVDEPPLRHTSKTADLAARVARILDRAGYERMDGEGWGGHVLRRSGARALFDELVTQGYDGALKTVQAMLGHANASMTESYLGLTIDREKRNQLLAGRPMFPSLQSPSVVNIRREA